MKQHARSFVMASVHVENLEWENFGEPRLSHRTHLSGCAGSTIIQTPREDVSGNLFKTDSLKIYAGPNNTFGKINLGVEKYLYADLQSRKKLEVNYRSKGPIHIEQNVNKYGVVVPAE